MIKAPRPKEGTLKGTLHFLSNGKDEKIFEWQKDAWSTPKTGWSTDVWHMAVLGWKYERPV